MSSSNRRTGAVPVWLVVTLAVIAVGVVMFSFGFLCKLLGSREPAQVSAALVGSSYPERMTIDRPECPHTWDSVVVRDTFVTDPRRSVLSPRLEMRPVDQSQMASGPQTDVPEYNDCQRFPVQTDRGRIYGAFLAIFAADSFGTLADSLANPQMSPTARWRAAAQIYRYPDSLAAREAPLFLGVPDHFSCLYVFREGSDFRARMVPVDTFYDLCNASADPDTLPGVDLEVDTARVEEGGVPFVARWEWDHDESRPYVWLGCGQQIACEIGEPGFTPAASYATPVGTPQDVRRVLAIKGWHDQQELAVPEGADVRPGDIRGTIIPDPALDGAQLSDFAKTWVVAAYVALEATEQASADFYKKKMNLDPAPLTHDFSQLNEIAYCYGTRSDCDINKVVTGGTVCAKRKTFWCRYEREYWWTRVTSAGIGDAPGEVRFYCVHRRHHTEMDVPGTVRWRWLADDEGTWTACAEGCCQPQAGDS